MPHRILIPFVAALAAGFALAETPRQAPSQPAFPRELTCFVPHSENPVFTGRGAGHWDARSRERGWILHDDHQWGLWYTGYDGTRDGLKMLGYATSEDGIHWTRHPENPIYDTHWVEDMMVVERDGTYYMFAEGRDDQAQLLTSQDGIRWERQRQLEIRKTTGEPIEPGPYGTPTAWYEHGVWHLFYERGDRGVWLATSQDLKVFRNVQDEPVLAPGPAEYDHDLIALNQIVKHDGRYYAFYHGAAAGRERTLWSTAIAVSDDLIHWTKYARNPLFPIEENKSSGVLVETQHGFRLYTMHDRVDVHLPCE